MVQTKNYARNIMRGVVVGFGSCAVWYFSAPFFSESARLLFDISYPLLYGQPGHLAYYTTYVPMRSHFQTMAYNYGSVMSASWVVPPLLKFSDKITDKLLCKKSPEKNPERKYMTTAEIRALESPRLAYLADLANTLYILQAGNRLMQISPLTLGGFSPLRGKPPSPPPEVLAKPKHLRVHESKSCHF